MDSWEFYKRTGTIVGLAGAVIGVAWFCFTTVSRITTLESQMQALVITKPANDFQPYGATPSPQSDIKRSVEVNPITLVCADLAGKLYEKHKDKLAIPALDPISAVMNQLGCKKLN